MNVRRAIRFTTLATIANFALSLASVIIISRLLTPEEIGVFSVAVSLIAYTHILREFGVGQYFVQIRDLTRTHLRAGFTVMAMISWSIAALLLVSRHAVASFYGHHGLAELLAVLSINFIVLPFGSHILSVMKREMQFGRLAVINVSNAVVQIAVTLLTAMAGESYMSMAWGSIAGNLTNVLMLSLMRPEYALLLPSTEGLSKILSFGSKSSVNSIIGEIGYSGPDIIIGKTLGFEAVAILSRASSLNNMVVAKLIEIVSQVFFPAFAKGIREGREADVLYYDSARLVTGVLLPFTAVLAVVASPLIILLFGEQWHEAAALAWAICLYAFVRAPVALAGHALIAGGHVGTAMKSQLLIQTFRLALLLLTLWLSLQSVVCILLAASFAEVAIFVRALKRHYGLTGGRLFVELVESYRLAAMSVAGPLCLLGLAIAFAWPTTTVVYLMLSGLLACVGYAIALVFYGHPIRRELVFQLPILSVVLGRSKS